MRIFRPLIMIFTLSAAGVLFAAKWNNVDKLRVAILEIDNRIENEKIDAAAYSDIFQTQLSKRASFIIVERSILNKILQEQKLQLSGLTNAEVSKIGRLAEADKVISGSLSRAGGKLVLILKAVDVATGVLDFSDQIVAWTPEGLYDALPEAAERFVKTANGEKVAEFVIKDHKPSVKDVSATPDDNKTKKGFEPEISDKGLLVHYPFNKNAKDSSANKNNGIVIRSILSDDRFNRPYNAYWLNGEISYITSSKPIAFKNTMSLSMWINTSTTTGGRLLGFVTVPKNGSEYDDPRQTQIYITDEGHIALSVMTDDGEIHYLSSDETFNDSRWHLITALVSPEFFTLYIDGEEAKKEEIKGRIKLFPGYIRIGYDNLTGWTGECTYYTPNALVDDLRVYDRLLTNEEIMKLAGK